MEIDTGAAVSIISDDVCKKSLQHLSLKLPSGTLKTYTGEQAPVRGVAEVTVQLQTFCLPANS